MLRRQEGGVGGCVGWGYDCTGLETIRSGKLYRAHEKHEGTPNELISKTHE